MVLIRHFFERDPLAVTPIMSQVFYYVFPTHQEEAKLDMKINCSFHRDIFVTPFSSAKCQKLENFWPFFHTQVLKGDHQRCGCTAPTGWFIYSRPIEGLFRPLFALIFSGSNWVVLVSKCLVNWDTLSRWKKKAFFFQRRREMIDITFNEVVNLNFYHENEVWPPKIRAWKICFN